MPTRYPLEVYPPISLAGLSVSLPLLNAPKRLNVLTLIATLGIGISLCTELTKGHSIQIPGRPHFSISDTKKIMPMLAKHHMYIIHRYRADTNKS